MGNIAPFLGKNDFWKFYQELLNFYNQKFNKMLLDPWELQPGKKIFNYYYFLKKKVNIIRKCFLADPDEKEFTKDYFAI